MSLITNRKSTVPLLVIANTRYVSYVRGKGGGRGWGVGGGGGGGEGGEALFDLLPLC